MTSLLEQAIEQLRQLPESLQDSVARAVLLQLEEEPESGDREAIAEGLNEFERGDFIKHEQWRREMAPTDQ